jgi:cytochrome oxidase assembly protein ShyY1
MYRFLLSRRWLGLAAFVIFWMILCVFLSRWQFQRLHQREATNAQVISALAAKPVPLSDSQPEWTQVTATGVFDTSHEIVVRNQSRDIGTGAGVDIVTPLVLSDGQAVLVDRGWLETQRTIARPKHIPSPTRGTVTVTGWLHPNNGAGPGAVNVDNGQVRAISSDAISKTVKLPYRLHEGYISMQSQAPTDHSGLAPEPKPDLGNGPHLFYAIQWLFFGALAPVGYFWFARDEVRVRQGKPPTKPFKPK